MHNEESIPLPAHSNPFSYILRLRHGSTPAKNRRLLPHAFDPQIADVVSAAVKEYID